MNLDRYEKIDGWQALERFKDGKTAFCYYGNVLHEVIMVREDLYSSPVSNDEQQRSIRRLTLNEILERNWYKKKPFDVRQAMLERPNEWVGAFEVAENWYKVGFDTTFMQMACASILSEVSVDLSEDRVFEVQLSNLINCIPIEDVPEEATR